MNMEILLLLPWTTESFKFLEISSVFQLILMRKQHLLKYVTSTNTLSQMI